MGTDPSSEDPKPGAEKSADAWANAARDRTDRLHQRQPSPREREERKVWYQQLSTKLAAGVVFLVALTTLLGNLLELREKSRTALPQSPPAATPAPAGAPAVTPAIAAPAAPAGPQRLRVALDRIAVENDGSPGTTDWRFTVDADGQKLFAFEQDDLDDSGGRNVARPKDQSATLRLMPGKTAKIIVKGWRLSRIRMQGAPDVTGEGVLAGDGNDAVIRVRGKSDAAGAFVFYFVADDR